MRQRFLPAIEVFLGSLIAVSATFSGSLIAVSPLYAHEPTTLLRFEDGRAQREVEPALENSAARAATERPQATSQTPVTATVSIARAGRTVGGALTKARNSGAIDEQTYQNYLDIYQRANSVWRRLGGGRRQNLGAVIAQVKRLAGARLLTSERMTAVFTQLDNNRQWWGSKSAPASGARVTFSPSPVIYQYYPGLGMQFQPLANCGAANGYWQSKRYEKLRELVDDLVEMRVSRTASGKRFATLEYYFPFGGGSPPWISAMAQATCIQALTRAADVLKDPSYNEVATSMLPVFQVEARRGVRVSRSGGSWYALYNFAPRQYVLNGHLQTLVGLWDFNQLTGNADALALFKDGDKVAKETLRSYDTGAWSLYQPGQEANLNYHTLQRDFLRNLCKRTSDELYCSTADRFTTYLKEPPRIASAATNPKPAKLGSNVGISFSLSKMSTVGLTIRSSSGATVYSTSSQLGYGKRRFVWHPSRAGSFTFTLTAKDLAGNSSSPVTGSFSVRR